MAKGSLKRQITYAFNIKDNKVWLKDLKGILHFVRALNDADRDNRLREIDSNFGFLQPTQKDYMRAVYTRSYTKGQESVSNDIFTNSSSVTYNEIIDRFEDYPKIETPDWDFITKVAKPTPEALNEILNSSDQKGFEEDFSYYIYEKFYIDGSRELEEFDVEVPDGLNKDSIYFMSDMAYADGVENRVRELADKAVQEMAEEKLEEKP